METGNYSKQGIKFWSVQDRPREKLIKRNREALSEVELLAILIGSGPPGETAVGVAQRILQAVDHDLNKLGRYSVSEVMDLKIRGIGLAKAVRIVAAFELGRRKEGAEFKVQKKIGSSEDAAAIFIRKLGDQPHEEFWVLYLNRANRVISEERLSVGGLTGTVADIRIIFKMAVNHLASAMIVCHNHPSGNLSPSQADAELTKRLKKAGQLLDVAVLDHIIVTAEGYYSFADEGEM